MREPYHLPNGHSATSNLTLAGITQPHCLHCLVRLINSGHSLQIPILLSCVFSSAFGAFGFNKSQGLVVPSLSLYLSQGVVTMGLLVEMRYDHETHPISILL